MKRIGSLVLIAYLIYEVAVGSWVYNRAQATLLQREQNIVITLAKG